MPFQITINGQRRSVEVSPETPLLWILRDHLGLTGTKFGCGLGVCGSCTIHEGRNTVRACQIPAAEAQGRSFTTIEGLSRDRAHPVQKAWLEEDVAQCGYCQPGMIMCAAALLWKSRGPSDADINAAFAEMVCRCGSYPRIRRAVHRAAALARGTK